MDTPVDPRDAASDVKAWFSLSMGPSMMLSNSWFGRPYDNQHQLEFAAMTANYLYLELDQGDLTLLVESKGIELSSTLHELTIRTAGAIFFSRKEYGSGVLHQQAFAGGEVKFVRPAIA
jgi:hypothetical protein